MKKLNFNLNIIYILDILWIAFILYFWDWVKLFNEGPIEWIKVFVISFFAIAGLHGILDLIVDFVESSKKKN